LIDQDRPWQLIVNNLKYYISFQLIFVAFVVIFSSIGAFFHFLLDHEIAIVESWIHNNQWEILIFSKVLSLTLLNRWFSVRLYQLKSLRVLVRELVSWPDPKVVVVAIFMLISYLSVERITFVEQNLGYWYFQTASFLGLFLFFGIEFIVIAYLEDVLNHKYAPPRLQLAICYTLVFTLAFRMSVPDYYKLMPYVVMCYSSLIYLSGNSCKNWSNVVCFLLIFVAPMGPLFGLDPVWGEDFSLFRFTNRPKLSFLAVIWVISFLYYNYRDQLFNSIRKLLR
jgi:hypothetical protein